MNQAVVPGPSGDAMGDLVLAPLALGEHHLNGATDLSLVFLPGDVVDEIDEAVVAFLDDRLGDLVLHDPCRGVGTNGVLEGEGSGEPRLLDDTHGFGEVLVGLPGEPDDDVCGDGGVRNGLAHPVKDSEELLGPVGSAHPAQHLVRPGLQRHVQAGHDIGGLGHGLDDVIGEGGRVG